MTREQFFDLAQRTQALAQQHPRRYRLKVTLLAALGYGFLFGMMGFYAAAIVGGGWMFSQPWWWSTIGRSVQVDILAAAMILGFAWVLFQMVRSLFLPMPLPTGRRVERADAPELFAMIDEVVTASRAPRPHRVLLTWEFNASVCQRPRLGWLHWWTRDFLVVGVPLMASLSPAQFRAVLAHEFGHLRGGHGRFGNWVWRLRGIWARLCERIMQQGRGARIFGWFLRWYVPRFDAHTYALARAHEFEADRWSAEVAGLPAAGEALVHIWTRGRQLQEHFWQPLNARACREADLPTGVFADMLALLRAPIAFEDHQRWLRAALGEVTGGTDTHPSPAERLAALGLPATVAELGGEATWSDDGGPAPAAEASALALLGPRRDEFVAELEGSWRVLTGPVWTERHTHARASRERLEALAAEEAASPGGELPEAKAWERTRLEVDLAATRDEAHVAAERFAARWPGHALGRFGMGHILLAADDPEGLAHMQEAIRLDGRLAGEGEETMAAFLRRAGRHEEAAERTRNAVRQGDVLDAGREERLQVTTRDTFLPHGLDAAAVEDLCAQLARHPRVWKVWLARKVVRHYPEQPWYVMVCVFRWKMFEAGTQKRLQGIYEQIRKDLTVAGRDDFYFFLVDVRNRNTPLARKVRKTGGDAWIYPPPAARRPWWRWWGGKKAAVPAPATEQRAPSTPPPLPVLPTDPHDHSPARAGRVMSALALVAALLVVALPVAYVIHRAMAPGGAWQRLRAGGSGGSRNDPALVAEAGRAIPRDPQALTAEDDRRALLAWGKRTMLAGYDRAGKRNTRWNTQAHAFIERALPWWAGLHDCPTTAADLLPPAHALLHSGCDDPVVCYLAGLAETRADAQSTAAAGLFGRAVNGFQTAPYARGVAWIAAAEAAADCERRRDGTDQSRTAKGWWVAWFREMLRDGSFQPGEQPALAMQIYQGEGQALFKEFGAACTREMDVAGDGAVAPWLRLWMGGKCHVENAWRARGSGYAREVTAEGWRGFREEMALARRDLVASWQLEPRRPEAAGSMIGVALGQNTRGSDGPRAWFERSVRAQVDYGPSYERYALSLTQKWGGSLDAMRAFGMACAATEDYATGVPMQLNTIADDMEPGDGYGRLEVYAALEKVFAGYEAAPSQAGRRVYYHGWHARAAELTGHYAEAYRLLREVDFALPPDLTHELADAQLLSGFVERIAAYGGPGGTDALSGDQLLRRGRTDTALVRFRAALESAGTEPRASRYLQARINSLETNRRLDAGDWIGFQPTAGPGGEPLGWTGKLGAWRVAPDGSLVGQCGASGMMLVNDAAVGPDFEVRGELDFLPGAPGEVQGGVVFGHPDMEGEDWQSFRLKRGGPEGGIATVSRHWHDGPTKEVTVPDHNTFSLQSWRGRLTLVVNGQTVFSAQPLEPGRVGDGSGLVGLGGYAHHGNTYSVAYRNLQIRRLHPTGKARSGESVAAR